MKKIISVILCVLLLLGTVSLSCFAAKEESTETTKFVFEIDVNERYTDIIEATDDEAFYQFYSSDDDMVQAENNRRIYIAVLVSVLVVALVVLAVSVKKVPKEEDIDISGTNKKERGK